MKLFSAPQSIIFLCLLFSISCSTEKAGLVKTKTRIIADYILLGGPIYTIEENHQVEAVAIKGNKIIYAGSLAGANRYTGEQTNEVDLQGNTLIPGFNESHGHLMGLGYELSQLDLSDAKNYQEIVNAVEKAVKEAQPGEWILGNSWHQSKWNKAPDDVVKGFQTNDLLNKISPNNPVLLAHASGHAIFVNEVALALAKVDQDTEVSEDSEIIKRESGKLTGILTENAMNLVYAVVPKRTVSSNAKALTNALKHLAENGITSFQDAGSESHEIDTFRAFANNGKLTSRLYIMLAGWNDSLMQQWLQSGPELDDNHWLNIRGIKFSADGALGSRGAWLLEEYSDRKGHFGNPVMTIDQIKSISDKGIDNGFQIAIHAIGDRANQQVLDLFQDYKTSEAYKNKDLRLRIEHAQHLAPEDISRFGKYNIIASMQGIHMSSDRPWAIDRLGIERIESGAYMWRSLLDTNAVVVNGTDVPVEPVNPIASYYSLVTRQTLAGTPEGGYEPSQKLTRDEALKTYTLAPAYATFEEHIKGSIAVGKLADFTLLSKDIINVADNKLLDTAIVATIVNGKLVYCNQANANLCKQLD